MVADDIFKNFTAHTVMSRRLAYSFQAGKAGFKPGLYFEIYAVYADHFAHVGRVFSAINADLRRSDRPDAEYKHSYNTPTFTLTFVRLLKLC